MTALAQASAGCQRTGRCGRWGTWRRRGQRGYRGEQAADSSARQRRVSRWMRPPCRAFTGPPTWQWPL